MCMLYIHVLMNPENFRFCCSKFVRNTILSKAPVIFS